MQKKIKILIVFLLIMIFIFTLSFFLKLKIEQIKRLSYLQGWEAARNRVNELSLNSGIVDLSNIENLYGKVISIDDNKIEIKINPIELLANPDLDYRNILIDDKTKFYLYQMKEDEKYYKELEEYKEKQTENEFIPNPAGDFSGPSRYENILVEKNALASGQYVEVYAYENVRTAKTFTAKEIIIKN